MTFGHSNAAPGFCVGPQGPPRSIEPTEREHGDLAGTTLLVLRSDVGPRIEMYVIPDACLDYRERCWLMLAASIAPDDWISQKNIDDDAAADALWYIHAATNDLPAPARFGCYRNVMCKFRVSIAAPATAVAGSIILVSMPNYWGEARPMADDARDLSLKRLRELMSSDPLPNPNQPKQETDAMTEKATPQQITTPTLQSRLHDAGKRAPYRVARMQALTNGKDALLNAVKNRASPAAYDAVKAYLDTPAGQGTLIAIIGLVGPHLPKVRANVHAQAVCDEFVEEGVALGLNQAIELLGAIIEPVLSSAFEALP